MPVAKIHVLEGQYDERRLTNVSKAIQDGLISVLKIPTRSSCADLRTIHGRVRGSGPKIREDDIGSLKSVC